MSVFANLVAAVAVALRDVEALDLSTPEGAALWSLTLGAADPEQKALSFAVRVLERTTRVLLDDVPVERIAAIVDDELDLTPLAAVDTASALTWLRAFDRCIHENRAGLSRVLAFAQNTTLPQVVTTALARAHAGDLRPTSLPLQFAGPDGALSWRLVPNISDDVVLVVPVDDVGDGHVVGVRRTLSGSVLRTWWATWELAYAQKSDGFFHVEMRHIILDLFGMKPEVQTKNGRRYSRPPRRIEEQVDEALTVLERTLVGGVSGITVENPEPLIHRYGEMRYDGRLVHKRVYAHARLVWASRNKRFLQLPRAAFRLDAGDAPLAMSLAALLRSRVRDWLRAGAVTMTLQQLVHALGEDVDRGVRRFGRKYWVEAQRRLARVIPAGGFGSVRFGLGIDGGILVTIELWPPLAAAYSGLLGRRLAPVPAA